MSRNGSGVYSLPAGNPVVTGTTISSTWANNTLSDMANALTGSVASDGQTAMTGNLQMGNNKITGLANGTNAQDAVTYSQLTGLAPATSGSSVLAGNGAGGFTNVTLATGLTYSSNTLTADINNLLPSQTGNSGRVLTTNGTVTSWGTAGGNGTVTSVALSGGTTGITVSGSPITSSGTMTLAGTLAVTSGGTGATSTTGALTNLLPSQASQSGKFLTTNGTSTSWASAGTGTVTSVALSGGTTGLTVSGSPITSSGTITLGGTLAVANGGTGATSASAARTSLGLGTIATQNANAITVTGGTMEGLTKVEIGSTSGTQVLSVAGNAGISYSGDTLTVENTNTGSTGSPIICATANTSGSTRNLVFFINGATNTGRITTDGTNTTYSTSSDYRLKENVAPMTGAVEKVKALKPVSYTWKSTGKQGQGFIAHELQAIVPDAVVGDKDAIDEKGNPSYQSIDTSFLVATLTAALQEALARIETLETKIGV